MFKQLWLLVLSAAAASAAPVISAGGVFNAASYVPLGASGTGLAQGSYFVVFGTGLGPATTVVASQPFPTALGGSNGSSVTITPAAGSSVQAYIYYAGNAQLSGIIPSNTPAGPATMTVTYNGATSASAKINIVKSNFGILTVNQQGSGPALIQNAQADGTVSLNSLTSPAGQGQVMVLYGTGLGPISGPDNSAPGAISPAGISVQVLAGGQSITPLYAGRSPAFAGEDQINFQLPNDSSIPDSCFVPIAVQVNGVVSNYATFAKAAGFATCPAPLGLSANALKTLDAGGAVNVGLISLAHTTIPGATFGLNGNIVTEAAAGVFTSYNASQIYGLYLTPGAAPPLNPPGTCIVQSTSNTTIPASTIPPTPLLLDAGAQLTLSGPGTASVPFVAKSGYTAMLAQSIPGLPPQNGLPSSFLSAGTWTIKGIGGADVGPFSASVTIPTQMACTNCSSITTIDRTKPLTVTWTGGGGSGDFVQVGGTSTAASVANPNTNLAVVFACTARASDGTFTVPVSVLSQMPPSSSNFLAANVGALILANVLGNSSTSFTAPLTKAGNLDLGFFGYAGLFIQLAGYN